MKAKFEIIEALDIEQGMAVFNADDPRCMEMSKWHPGEKVHYSAKGRYQAGQRRTDFLAMEIKPNQSGLGLQFVDNQNAQAEKIRLNLLGAQDYMVSNYLAALSLTRLVGYSSEDIKQAVKSLQELSLGLRAEKQPNHIWLIDDGYSSNPTGFLAALEILAKQEQGRKIVVTRGMLELGEQSDQEHRKLGKTIAQVADLLLLLDKDHEVAFRQGIGLLDKSQLKTVVEEDLQKAAEYLKNYLHKGDVVLIEGRINTKLYQAVRGNLRTVSKTCSRC